jgi:DNA/RNA-binding domain of Phe-tRNA-synthetase-like protein
MYQNTVNPHLRAHVVLTDWRGPLASIPDHPALVALRSTHAEAPLRADDALRAAVRDLLRFHGFKPTGRSKPSSEYLLRAATEAPDGRLAAINAAVDCGNAISLHSGLPISVIDLDRAAPPFAFAPGAPGATYVFNRSGQTIDVAGLLSLHDAGGPCANPVKDAQRTKTDGETRRTLTVIWGLSAFAEHTDAARRWWERLAGEVCGATFAPLEGP